MCKSKAEGVRCLGHLKRDRENLLATQRKRAAEGKQPTAKQVQRLQRLRTRIEQAEAEHAAEQERKKAEATATEEREAEHAAARERATEGAVKLDAKVTLAVSEEDAEALKAAAAKANMPLTVFIRSRLEAMQAVTDAPLTQVQGSHHLTTHSEGKAEGRLPSKSGQARIVRLQVRVTQQQKRLLQQLSAADLLDTSMSSLGRALALGEDARRTYGDRSLTSRVRNGLPQRTEKLHDLERRMRGEGETINDAWTRKLQGIREAA